MLRKPDVETTPAPPNQPQPQLTPLFSLENSQHIRRAGDATGDVTRLAADEERPAAHGAAVGGELLEVEQLADRAAPASE